jgi:hypothetical protein
MGPTQFVCGLENYAVATLVIGAILLVVCATDPELGLFRASLWKPDAEACRAGWRLVPAGAWWPRNTA